MRCRPDYRWLEWNRTPSLIPATCRPASSPRPDGVGGWSVTATSKRPTLRNSQRGPRGLDGLTGLQEFGRPGRPDTCSLSSCAIRSESSPSWTTTSVMPRYDIRNMRLAQSRHRDRMRQCVVTIPSICVGAPKRVGEGPVLPPGRGRFAFNACGGRPSRAWDGPVALTKGRLLGGWCGPIPPTRRVDGSAGVRTATVVPVIFAESPCSLSGREDWGWS
jgi:hypothetical protein